MQHHDNPGYHRWLKTVDIMQYLDRANLQLTEPMFFVVDHSYVLHFTILCI